MCWLINWLFACVTQQQQKVTGGRLLLNRRSDSCTGQCRQRAPALIHHVPQEYGTTNTTSSNDTLTFDQLEAMSYTQINSSQVLQQVANEAGYSSIDAMIPGLGMFWSDVSDVAPAVATIYGCMRLVRS